MRFMRYVATLILLVAVSAGSHASIIYSDLSAGESYNDGTGYALGYPGPSGLAVAFTPGAVYDLTEIDVGVTHISGANVVKIKLLADASGSPGALIHTWTLTGLPTFGSVHTIQSSQVISGITGITLSTGTQYWVAVFPGDDPSSSAAWNMDNWPTSNPATQNYLAQYNSGTASWYLPGFQDGHALKVLGDAQTAVPETGTLFLLVIGLGSLAAIGRRSRETNVIA